MWRRVAAQFAVLAIALQVLVIQPHIDPVAVASAHAASAALHPVPHPVTVKADAHGQGAACIICQAALSGRIAVTAGEAPAPFEPQALYAATPLPEAPLLSATPSHAWRSRGPPSLV